MGIQGTRFYGVGNAPQNIPDLNLASNNVPYLTPNGTGCIDVLNDLYWSNSGDVSEVPFIMATEYELQFGTWVQNLANAYFLTANATNLKDTDPYLTLYSAKPTGFSYAFPWLVGSENPKIRSVGNQWSDASAASSGSSSSTGGTKPNGKMAAVSNFVGAALGVAGAAISPGIGLEATYQYNDTNIQELTIKFPLYNTIDTKSALDNYNFVSLFTFQNLKNRTSFITFIPPKIYSLDGLAFGGIYWPAAYVSNLDIESIGTARYLYESGYNAQTGGKGLLVPEAYKISITFKQLVADSSNIFSGTMGGTKVQVLKPIGEQLKANGAALGNEIKGLQTAVGQGVQNLGNKLK